MPECLWWMAIERKRPFWGILSTLKVPFEDVMDWVMEIPVVFICKVKETLGVWPTSILIRWLLFFTADYNVKMQIFFCLVWKATSLGFRLVWSGVSTEQHWGWKENAEVKKGLLRLLYRQQWLSEIFLDLSFTSKDVRALLIIGP